MLKRNLTGLSSKTTGKCFGRWREGGFGMAFPAASLFGNERCPHSCSAGNTLRYPAFEAILSSARPPRSLRSQTAGSRREHRGAPVYLPCGSHNPLRLSYLRGNFCILPPDFGLLLCVFRCFPPPQSRRGWCQYGLGWFASTRRRAGYSRGAGLTLRGAKQTNNEQILISCFYEGGVGSLLPSVRSSFAP